jgi:hypothetical protein
VLTSSGGTVRYASLPPFAIPAGAIVALDSAPPAGAPGECRHDLVLPEGGFRVPTLDLPSLGYCARIIARGCESGSGPVGAGTLWDGNGAPGLALTNVDKAADTSDGTCDATNAPCTPPSASPNPLGNVDTTFSPAAGGGVRATMDVPIHTVVWMDSGCNPTTSPGCCGPANFGDDVPANGEFLIYEANAVLTLTTNTATAAFVDQNGDGCARSGAGFGGPTPDGPSTVSGTPLEGRCCERGVRGTLVGKGVEFSGGAPVYDVATEMVLPVVVTQCTRARMDSCTVTTDPCLR